jgi:hypothetical protein
MKKEHLNNLLGGSRTWADVDEYLTKSDDGAIASKWSDGTWRLRHDGREWALDTDGNVLKTWGVA